MPEYNRVGGLINCRWWGAPLTPPYPSTMLRAGYTGLVYGGSEIHNRQCSLHQSRVVPNLKHGYPKIPYRISERITVQSILSCESSWWWISMPRSYLQVLWPRLWL